MITLAVFDMAGTTVLDNDAVKVAFRQALDHAAVRVSDQQVQEVMGLPKPQAIELLLQQAGRLADAAEVAGLHATFVEKMKAYYAHDTAVGEVPGSREVFATLRQAGVKVALNTGFSRDIVDVLLTRLGWNVPEVVDATICSDEVPRGRPFPDMIHALMQRFSINSAQQVAKIGDTWADIDEGHKVGCRFIIGVTTGTYSREKLLERHPTHVLESVREVPGVILGK